MDSTMYITEAEQHQSNGVCSQKHHIIHHSTPKYASASSIPSLIESCPSAYDIPDNKSKKSLSSSSSSSNTITTTPNTTKTRRHSVLDDLKARKDSFLQKARRSSIFEDKENKEKRKSNNQVQRRGSVFYVSHDNLLNEENEKKDNKKDNNENNKDDNQGDNNNVKDSIDDDDVNYNKNTNEDETTPLEVIKKGRRKSWHPLVGKSQKLDRKRRKNGTNSESEVSNNDDGVYNARQKRPSWWNIFVPDSVGRSRRMSQDVTHARSTENIPSSLFRSKSRSVDHGFTAPFDLDSLRNKVEGRFESIDKLSRDSDESKDGSSSQEKKSGGRLSQPINTIAYTVGDRDTLTSVAARFDTTPSELSKLNRLVGTFIYPGQQLWVPAKGEGAPGGKTDSDAASDATNEQDGQDDLPTEEKELLDNLRPVSPKPGHLERVKTPLGANAMDHAHHFKERFLKITVRHITDGQGVVSGVLLVTPNAVMFDPNVSDPLVIEHGPESYGVIAPMEFIVNAAIYYDIAHMRVGHTEVGPPEKKPEIYYMKKPVPPTPAPSLDQQASNQSQRKSTASPGKDDSFPELTVDDSESVCSCAERDGDAFPKAFDKDLVTPTNLSSDESSTKDKEEEKKEESSTNEETGGGQSSRSLEERRRSMLDHHWAVPSKDRCSFSVDDEQQDSLNSEKADSSKSNAIPEDEEGSLVKQSCHDSGIDIREPNVTPLPVVQPIAAKKVYSDADIVLSSDWVPPVTIVPTNTTSTLEPDTEANGRKKTGSVSFSLDSTNEEHKEEEHKEDDKQETRKNKMLKRLSYPLSWMEGFTGDSKDEENKPPSDKMSSVPSSADSSHHSSVFSKVFSRRSSVGTFIRQQPINSSGSSSVDSSRGNKTATAPPRLDYRSMVSVEDMPELFVSFDKLIPRPARSCEDPPLYLRLRTGRPKDKKIPWSTPIMSYGKKKIRPEYWFSIPRNRVDDLYRFIHAWVPSLYGELDEEYWRERGYILSDTDTDLSPELTPRDSTEAGDNDEAKDADGKTAEISELTRESWEVLSMSEELRRALYANSAISLDAELTVPDLIGTTEILSEDHREQLCRHLPARAEGYMWTLVFSTSQHGFSLNSMYRKMTKVESPILLVIEDTEGNVFGALTSCSLRVSDHFYGTGESLLFRFSPRFQVFNWTGDNVYFIKGNNESLAIGAGDGKFGLWLDGDLYQGRTQSCSTYGNEPLAPREDFVVKTLECWAFI